MALVTAPTGDETRIRAIVFKEGDSYVAQCLEYDIAAQAPTLAMLLDRLDLTIETEFEACAVAGKQPHCCISPAPNYYHGLWDTRSINLDRVNLSVPDGAPSLEVALAA